MASYRPPRALLVTLGAALACTGLAAPANAAADCDARGSEVVQLSPGGKIAIVRNGNYEGHELYMACWRPTGKLQPMSSDWLVAGRAPTAVGAFNFRGPWVTWAQTSVDGTETDSMRSLNVRTGRLGPRVFADPDARAAEDHGPIQHTGRALSRMVAISRSGMYAWLVRGARTPEGEAVDALYVPHDGSALRVDVGEVGSIERLFFRGQYLVWVRDGEVRTIKPDSSSAEPPVGDDVADACHPTLPNGSWPPGEQPSPGWHGNGSLWTNILSPHGVLRFGDSSSEKQPTHGGDFNADGSVSTKILWIRSRAAGRTLKIRGHLIGDPATRLQARVLGKNSGAASGWFTYLTFAKSGCWRVEAIAGEAKMSVRVKVVIPPATE